MYVVLPQTEYGIIVSVFDRQNLRNFTRLHYFTSFRLVNTQQHHTVKIRNCPVITRL